LNPIAQKKHPSLMPKLITPLVARLAVIAAMWLGFMPSISQAANTFANTGPLATARRKHTATLLPNGKLLVAGGNGSGNALASAELYDPSTGIWTGIGSLNTGRESHTATLLPNGKVLVAGGEGGQRLSLQCGTLRSGHRHLGCHRLARHRPQLSHRDAAAYTEAP
jgi:hypothetical protein